MQLTSGEIARYTRQIRLSGFGAACQQKLKDARVLVVGAGGLGCPVIQYLTASGMGTLGVIDNDIVQESNLHRQVLFGVTSVGRPKVAVVRERMRELNPYVELITFHERLSVSNVERIFSLFDVIVDGSDNFETRYLVNDACVVFEKPFVSASIFEFEGQVSVFNYRDASGNLGPTYRCLFPEPPQPEEVPNCAENGVLGILPGLMGMLQANEVIKVVTGIGEVLSGRLLLVNTLAGSMRALAFGRQEQVAASTSIQESYHLACVGGEVKTVQEITPRSLKERLDSGEDIALIDVREPDERAICNIGGDLIPMNSIADAVSDIPRDKPVVVYCRSGGRSGRVVDYLQKEHAFTNLFNLAGGVLRWSDDVDSSVRKY